VPSILVRCIDHLLDLSLVVIPCDDYLLILVRCNAYPFFFIDLNLVLRVTLISLRPKMHDMLLEIQSCTIIYHLLTMALPYHY